MALNAWNDVLTRELKDISILSTIENVLLNLLHYNSSTRRNGNMGQITCYSHVWANPRSGTMAFGYNFGDNGVVPGGFNYQIDFPNCVMRVRLERDTIESLTNFNTNTINNWEMNNYSFTGTNGVLQSFTPNELLSFIEENDLWYISEIEWYDNHFDGEYNSTNVRNQIGALNSSAYVGAIGTIMFSSFFGEFAYWNSTTQSPGTWFSTPNGRAGIGYL